MMNRFKDHHLKSPIILLSSINPSRNSFTLTPSRSITDQQQQQEEEEKLLLLVYASGLIINLLDLSSFNLYQSIHLIDHLPHLSSYPLASIDALSLTSGNRSLAVSSGPLTAIFQPSGSDPSSPWSLNSTFSSTHLSRILSTKLQEPCCLLAGQDGLSLYQLEQKDHLDFDHPPRWFNTWTLRGRPYDDCTLEILEDGTYLIVAAVLGSTSLETYQLQPSSQASHHLRQISHSTIPFSLPVSSIHLSNNNPWTNKGSHPSFPSLSVQVINPVLGSCVHFYNFFSPSNPLVQEKEIAHQSNSTPTQSPTRYVHTGIFALPVPLHSPRALAVFSLDTLSDLIVSQNPQLAGAAGARSSLVVLSNGHVNLALSSKNTILLSQNPFVLPEDILELLLKKPSSLIHITLAIKNDFSEDLKHLSCFMVIRPLTLTGEIFVTEIPLGELLVNSVVGSSPSRCLLVRRLPFGFTPLFTPLGFQADEKAPSEVCMVTTIRNEESVRYVCLCNQAQEKELSGSQLFAYATDQVGAFSDKYDLIGKVQAAGCLENNSGYCKDGLINSVEEAIGEATTSSLNVGSTGVFLAYLDHRVLASIRPLPFNKISLNGFKKEELPNMVVVICSDSLSSNKNHTAEASAIILCLSSLNRLMLWNLADGFRTPTRDSSADGLPREVSLPETFLITTLARVDSLRPIILALDTQGQLVRGVLTESCDDSVSQSPKLKLLMSHSVGAKLTLNLTDIKSQVLIFELQEESRFLAMLCVLRDTDSSRTYRIVFIDLNQQPYSAGIVGLDDFEIKKEDCPVQNPPRLRWSRYQKRSCFLKNEGLLAVCCSKNVVRIYQRGRDGWWKQTTDVQSKLGSISQISWLTSADEALLVYQASGHVLSSPPIATSSNISVPLWHPIRLKNMILFGEFSLAFAILACLCLALKGAPQPLIVLCEYLSYCPDEDEAQIMKRLEQCESDLLLPQGMSPIRVSNVHIDVLSTSVNEGGIPLLSASEALSLLFLARASLQIQAARDQGIDFHGCQYVLGLTSYLESQDESEKDGLGFGPTQNCGILQAQLSSSQALLTSTTCSIITAHAASRGNSEFKLNWHTARSIGLFLWLKSQEDIHSYIERIGQAEYVGGTQSTNDSNHINYNNNHKEQDPAACSLFYMALKKKRLVLGLWKVAYGHSDRPHMLKFLQNDFSEARWKTAAQKNAFALISRQRFRFAASFFLLADRLQDAVNVCVRQLSDWQLALAIARAYEGDRGPVLKKLLAEVVLPLGFSNGSRWLVSWCFNMLDQSELATRILVASWDDLVIRSSQSLGLPECPAAVRVGPLDLALVVLFNKLKIKQPLSALAWEEERSLILLSVDELLNSGCEDLALRLARTWNIDRGAKPTKATQLSPNARPGSSDHDKKSVSSQAEEALNSDNLESTSSLLQTDHKLLAEDETPVVKKRVLTQPVVPEFDMSNFF